MSDCHGMLGTALEYIAPRHTRRMCPEPNVSGALLKYRGTSVRLKSLFGKKTSELAGAARIAAGFAVVFGLRRREQHGHPSQPDDLR